MMHTTLRPHPYPLLMKPGDLKSGRDCSLLLSRYNFDPVLRVYKHYVPSNLWSRLPIASDSFTFLCSQCISLPSFLERIIIISSHLPAATHIRLISICCERQCKHRPDRTSFNHIVYPSLPLTSTFLPSGPNTTN